MHIFQDTMAKRPLPGRVLAAPSWVMPGSVAENCVFLANKVDEVGLLFFETASCMAYGAEELPPELADLPLSYHVHLPSDLPMHAPAQAADICHALLQKVAYLNKVPSLSASPCGIRAVLHPPVTDAAGGCSPARLLGTFLDAWAGLGNSPACLLLENIRGNDLVSLEGLIAEYSLRVCLDMGHAIAYGQHALLRHEKLLERVGMVHVSAPGTGRSAGAHLPLTALDPAGRELAKRMCRSVPPSAVIMMELFSWEHIAESLPLMREWLLPHEEKGVIL